MDLEHAVPSRDPDTSMNLQPVDADMFMIEKNRHKGFKYHLWMIFQKNISRKVT
jgi:hypothetical protein